MKMIKVTDRDRIGENIMIAKIRDVTCSYQIKKMFTELRSSSVNFRFRDAEGHNTNYFRSI